jgi:hypothetical protein
VSRFDRLATRSLVLAVALAPAAATYLLIRFRLDGEIGDFVPHFWNDQVGYWHYVLSFSEVGFDSGYYTPNERPADVGFVHYDIHGPAFQMIYGAVARVVGWELWTSIPVNMALVALALAAFAWAARLDRRQILLLGLVAVTFWPLLLYLPTSSQETLHQVLAVALALAFSALIARGAGLPSGVKAGILAMILAAALVRFSWALLLIPFFVLVVRRRTASALAGGLAVALGLTGLVLLAFSAISAPALPALSNVTDLSGGVGEIVGDAYRNFKAFFHPGTFDATSVQALQISGLIALALAGVVLALPGGWWTAYPERSEAWSRAAAALERLGHRDEWLFHLLNLGILVAASLVFYFSEAYYRLMGAPLLLSLLVLIRFRRFALVALVAVTNLVMLGSFLNLYDQWRPNFEIDKRALAQQRAELARVLRYDEDAPSPWCNTVLIPIALYDSRVTLVPAGVGVSYTLPQPDARARPVKSRYVLVDDTASDLAPLVEPPRLEPLGTFAFGRLYRNPDSPCGAEPG